MRIAEYGSVIASEIVLVARDEIELIYPDSVVVFLRPGRNIPKQLKITHRAPNGSKMSYDVPAIQIKDHMADVLASIDVRLKKLVRLPSCWCVDMDGMERI